MTRTTMITALFAAATTTSAMNAQVFEIAVDRYNLSASDGVFDTDGPTTTNGPTSGDWTNETFTSAVMGGNGGSAYGYQAANASVGVYGGFVDAAASAFGDGSDFASGYGDSNFTVDFDLGASGGDWTLEGFVNAFGDINGEISEAYINFIDLNTNTIIWGTFVDNDFEQFNEAGSLGAGSYRLEANALAIVDRIFENGFGDSTATVDFNFTVTPAPGTVALLSLGALGVTLRRRA
ncbi:MAG: hypothetical protein DHS20C14_03880 [Phycisphaeraceae bacterium]|nr:MAG: hypothetical protein DHS20C14_03880 [Phycisphaeraceae bacterium]